MKKTLINASSSSFARMIAVSTAVALTTAVVASPPTVVSLSPENEATLVPADSNLVATFSEPIQAVAPTVTTLLDEDFETDDGGFTVKVADATGSQWAHGAPDSVGEFGGSVTSGNDASLRCWGINLGDFTNDPAERGYFVASTVTSLRSPVIDLTSATSAELVFAEALDIEAGDSAVVNIISATTDDVIAAAIHTSLDANPSSADWQTVGPIDLSAGLGQQIRIEWSFSGSGGASNDYLGWYIDDVQISEVIPPDGVVTLKNLSLATESIIPINDPQISVSGDTLTIDPDTDLSAGDFYAVQISAGAITNISDEPFAGILDDTTWSFKVAAGPTVITPVSATSTSTIGSGGRIIDNTINGSDLDGVGDILSQTHTVNSSNSGGYWLSGNGAVNMNDGTNWWSTTEVLIYTLPESSVVNAVHMWTYDRLGDNPTRAIKTYDISFSTDGGLTYPTTIPGSTLGNFLQGNAVRTDGRIPVQSKFFDAQSDVTHIRLDNIYITGANAYMGMSEIRFGGLSDEVAPGDTYADWIAGFPAVGGLSGFNDDPDGDGIPNGMENFFGTSPDAFSTGLLAAEVTGDTFTFTHPQNATPASDISGSYVWSKDLAAFHDDGASDGDGTTVSFNAVTDTPSPGMTTVTATVTGTPAAKLFVNIKVTQDP